MSEQGRNRRECILTRNSPFILCMKWLTSHKLRNVLKPLYQVKYIVISLLLLSRTFSNLVGIEIIFWGDFIWYHSSYNSN